MKTFLGVIVAACLAWAFPAASDERWSATYDVQLLGAKIGEISFAGTQRNGGYAARSRFRTTGLVAGLKRMHADVSVTGRTSAAACRWGNRQQRTTCGHVGPAQSTRSADRAVYPFARPGKQRNLPVRRRYL